MLGITLQDGASATLAGMPDRLREALSSKANMLAAALQAKIQDKLSGAVLNIKSGALARSIVATVDDASANVTVTIASVDIKYAAIHEYGGTIPPHEILPDKAKALAFPIGGKQTFAARVNLPAITMPERSYMRSSLAEMADEIRDGLSGAVVGAMQ
jgi:phage gpG-like protein